MSKLIVQVDDELEKEASKLYEDLGFDITTAIRMFLIQSVRTRSLPINVTLEEPFISDEEFIKIIEEIASNRVNFDDPTDINDFFGDEDFSEYEEIFKD
ncbi:type II toxin-antitoxin system RelB/DinJ family antitoxin [Streptococcus gallolyticus]|uniref:DNA-damage-inducible protein J n=1 Tax=Streptococcus gallolyticus TaxID=315405 RepID=A0A139R377_9STRE|nr:type II toxin-antitoxin system RelB/DinJ family antitoxin [Streptococcus gallolyticus]KXT67237.1 DNA-damage-inducible protein J [Streptococcus gallolyticus]KXU09191.1 DNA-damage-inducible protein J [Streptococcus gallolyticus]